MQRRINPDQTGTLEWKERVVDADGDSLSVSLQLKAVDDGSGFTSDGRDSSQISWLDFNKQENTLQNGALETIVTITADRTALSTGYVYKFELSADDGEFVTTRETNLEIQGPQFINLMGQEDRFRQENGERVDQGGTARVVATTNFESDLDLDFVSAPVDVNNPTFDQSVTDISQGKKYHEFFFNVSPDTLYAFRVTAKFGANVTEKSKVFYLTTGSEVSVSPAELALPTVFLLSFDTEEDVVQETGGSGVFEDFHSSVVSDESLSESISTSTNNDSFSTSEELTTEVGGSQNFKTSTSNQEV